MKYLFALVYILVLATQLPHVWYAYASLEVPDVPLAQYTAIGAALAFELATGIFTYRIINGSRKRWTRVGLAFFIVASIVANGYYYQVSPFIFDAIWPAFAMLALPIALALFAHEFGTEVKRLERAEKRRERKAEQQASEPRTEPNEPQAAFVCYKCDPPRSFVSQARLSGHGNAHRTPQDDNGTEPEVIERAEYHQG